MFDAPNILLSTTALVNAALVVFIYSRNRRSLINITFSLFALFLSFWALSIIQFRIIESDIFALYSMKFAYISAIALATSYYFFALAFPNQKKSSPIHTWGVITFSVVACALILLPGFLTKEVVYHEWGKSVILGDYEFLLFSTYFTLLFGGGLLRGWFRYFRETRKQEKIQLLLISLSVSGAGILGMYYNLVLPSTVFENFRFIWTGPLFTLFIALTITYSVFRHGLFQTKTIFAEILTFSLWIFIFIRFTLTNNLQEQIVDGLFLLVAVILGIFLIRSVNQEVEAKEKIAELAQDLKTANTRLKELDKLKTEFVSIASHQLRSPLAAVKGYASMLLEGSFGKLSVGAQEAIGRILTSSSFMARSVDDFLNVSRIELGRMKYEKSKFNICKIIELVVDEQGPFAEDKGLKLSYIDKTGKGICDVEADIGKVKQVLTNIVDNAIKYTQKGTVTIIFDRDFAEKKIRIDIADTGMGMSETTRQKLFRKFARADNANEINVIGTGLGLYVAKKLMEAQGGSISVTSEGEGKGSVFHLVLPDNVNP